MRKLRLAGIGCGGRTQTYMGLAAKMPDRFDLVGAADPISDRVELVRRLSGNPPGFKTFPNAEALLSAPKFADVVIIGTQDKDHVAPCIMAMEKGYDVLLEKPIATSITDVLRVERRARELGRRVLVCHVLRYSPFYEKAKEIVDSGMLGEIVTLGAVEGVNNWHQAHSFVRGHWGVAAKSNPMILAKSCHDMDLLSWFVGKPCESVSSFGGLSFFNAKHAPEGAPARCIDGCPVGETCEYNAMKYAGEHRFWASFVVPNPRDGGPTDQEITEFLKTSPWGRCVFKCDNDVVDHQVLNLKFQGGVTATFTMTAFNHGRSLEICGTKGTLTGGYWCKKHTGSDIIVTLHDQEKVAKYEISEKVGGYEGHGGGDPGLVLALYDEMTQAKPEDMRSSIHKSVESHTIGFAAEESRHTGKTVELNEFYSRYR